MKNLKEKLIHFIYNSTHKNNIPRNKFKKVKYMYTENYITWHKKIEEELNKWENILCPWVGKFNIVNIEILLQAIYRFSTILSKFCGLFFSEIKKKNFLFRKKLQVFPNSKNNLEK